MEEIVWIEIVCLSPSTEYTRTVVDTYFTCSNTWKSARLAWRGSEVSSADSPAEGLGSDFSPFWVSDYFYIK